MAYQTVNPANNQRIKQYAAHSDADVEAALQKADALYHRAWAKGDIDQRLPVLHRLADLIQDEPIWCSLGKPGTIPTKLKKMRENVKQFILPEKRKRPKKWTVRISKNQSPVLSKHLK